MIDIFTHILPAKYLKSLQKKASSGQVSTTQVDALAKSPPSLLDLDLRMQSMDKYPHIQQVLTIIGPPLEAIATGAHAKELARIANDELAEIVSRYPRKFAAAIASLPLNDIEASLAEIDRALNDLKLKGIQLFTNINGRPLDAEEFMPLYEKMQTHDLPVFLHPISPSSQPAYAGETGSKYNLAAIVGWPHDTTMAMMRLACSGVLQRYPHLKFVTHHAGGTVPYLARRIEFAPYGNAELSRPVTDYLRCFYNDTAVQGNTANLMCAYAFCGAGHLLLGSDFPMINISLLEATLQSIREMDITEAEKERIFGENARELLHLTA